MKQHLNNKGVTLVELIVSFALVATAIIYFYQTLYTVKKLYSQSQKETNEFVDVNYAYRLIDSFVDIYIVNKNNIEYFCDDNENYSAKNNSAIKQYFTNTCEISKNENSDIYNIEFEINEKPYNFYKYIKPSN